MNNKESVLVSIKWNFHIWSCSFIGVFRLINNLDVLYFLSQDNRSVLIVYYVNFRSFHERLISKERRTFQAKDPNFIGRSVTNFNHLAIFARPIFHCSSKGVIDRIGPFPQTYYAKSDCSRFKVLLFCYS